MTDFLRGGLLCAGFVSSFYVWPRDFAFVSTAIVDLRKASVDDSLYVDRNSDATILRRTVSLAVVVGASGCFLWSEHQGRTAGDSVNLSVSSAPVGNSCQRIKAVLSVVALFAGHIAEEGCDVLYGLPNDRSSAVRFFRDTVLCPFGEEVFFRGVLFVVLRSRSETACVLLSALLFSLSHAHHVVSWAAEECRRRVGVGKVPADSSGEAEDSWEFVEDTEAGDVVAASWRAAAVRASRTMIITGVFGLLSGYYYCRGCRRSIVTVGVVHSLCNFLGPPTFQCFRRNGHSNLSGIRRCVSLVTYVVGIAVWMWATL